MCLPPATLAASSGKYMSHDNHSTRFEFAGCRDHHFNGPVDFFCRGHFPDAEANRAPGPVFWNLHGGEHVRDLHRIRMAGRAPRKRPLPGRFLPRSGWPQVRKTKGLRYWATGGRGARLTAPGFVVGMHNGYQNGFRTDGVLHIRNPDNAGFVHRQVCYAIPVGFQNPADFQHGRVLDF